MLKSEKEAFNWGFEAGFLRSPVNPRMLLLNRTPEIDCAGDGNTSGNASAWSLVSIANDLLRVDLSSLFNEIASHFRERANRRFYIDLQNAMRQPPAAPHPAQHTSMDCAAEPDHDDWLDPDDPDQEPTQAELNEAEIAINLQKQRNATSISLLRYSTKPLQAMHTERFPAWPDISLKMSVDSVS